MREKEESTIERTENKWNSPNRESKMEHLVTISNTLKRFRICQIACQFLFDPTTAKSWTYLLEVKLFSLLLTM